MGTLLDLVALHLRVKKKALMDVIRLERNIVFESANLVVGHLQILQDLAKLAKLTDHMILRFVFNDARLVDVWTVPKYVDHRNENRDLRTKM